MALGNDGNGMTMHLVAHKLTTENLYYVKFVDKSSGWNPFNDNRYSSFYGQANEYSNVEVTFSWSISSHNDIEINMKNADRFALLEQTWITGM